MKLIFLGVILCAIFAYGGFIYGKMQVKTKIVEKQVEVIKYVAKKRAKIQAEPNAARDDLLKLMQTGKL